MIKAVKEKDPKNKDKYNVKYLSLTEINEEAILSANSDGQGALFSQLSMLNKCDAIILLFESNDAEQVEFVKQAHKLFSSQPCLKFTPIILLQTKMDLQMPESGDNRSMLG